MPANKYALIRYRTIDRCLRNEARPFPSKEELRAACEEALYGSDGDRISTSTLEKDLNAMRYDGALGYYAPIAYHRDERGYYYEEEDFSIDNLQLNDEELAYPASLMLTVFLFGLLLTFFGVSVISGGQRSDGERGGDGRSGGSGARSTSGTSRRGRATRRSNGSWLSHWRPRSTIYCTR